MSRNVSSLKAVFSVACLAAVFAFVSDPAFAQQEGAKTLGEMTNNFYRSTVSLQTFLSLLSYILGIYFSITGMIALRNHVEDAGRNPLNRALLRLGAAAFFVFTPTFGRLLMRSIGVGENPDQQTLQFSNSGDVNPSGLTGDGLEAVLNRLMIDMGGPLLDNALPFLAYVSGLIFMLIGLKRLALSDGDGPQAPGGMGTIGTFIVAAALMAFGYVVFTIEGSLFGTSTIINSPTFIAGESASKAMIDHANNAMWGVFIFLRIVGYISMLRALFMLRGAGEGQNVSMMAVCTHLFAGAMLANATGFVMLIQEAFVTDPSNYILQAG